MRFLLSLQILALSLLAPQAIANSHGNPHAARHAHDSIARRAPGDVAVHKRATHAKWSFYDVGMGACGQVNVASDFIVALNSGQFGSGYPGPHCFQQISMSYNGKTTTAIVMDACPGCPNEGLDLSRGLFNFFAPESEGIIYGEWNFVDGSSSPTTTTTYTPPSPTTTSTTPAWTPTTTQQQPSSSSTPPPPSTTSSQSSPSYPPSSSSELSSSNSNYNSGTTSGLTIPTPATVSDNGPHNLLGINQVVVTLGAIVVKGESAE